MRKGKNMKIKFWKKAVIMVLAIGMMSTTVMAGSYSWTMTLNQSSYAASSTSGTKSTRNNFATVKRTDNTTLWSRTQFCVYVEDTSGKGYKSEVGTVTYPSASSTVYYVNYTDSFIGESYKTKALLSSTSYYSSYTLSGQTTP